jgi:methionyl-tRNA synthetase
MSDKNFYITTPIYYVNDSPHIGHAYTTTACDVMARFKRLDGYDVKFLTGTDEHGQKVDKAAEKAGIDPQLFTDEVSMRFRNLVNSGENLLNVSNDDFIRTTETRHKLAAQTLWKRMEERGHIYLDTYEGWYSVRDEAYYQESELIEKNGKKIAPSGAEVEWVKEESYFFNLSKWQQKLLDFYEEKPDFVIPNSRYNEVKSFVRGGKQFEEGALKDLSISRTTFNWGVPVPGNPKHVMYVWIDALTNYLTAIGFPATDSIEYNKFWEGNSESPIHVVGKDIIRFHAVYWPAFLMAAELPLPKKIVAHGWWTIDGEKMSKSTGNVIAPKDLVEEFGLDQTRYFLMREVPFGNDGNFSRTAMAERINSDLANNIGNLSQRTLSMIQKNCDGVVPQVTALTEADEKLLNEAQVTPVKIQETKTRIELHIKSFRFDAIVEDILKIATCANEYIDTQAPWKLKDDTARRDVVLYTLSEAVRCIAIMLQPFMPDSSRKILLQLGYNESDFDNKYGGISFEKLSSEFALNSGTKLPAPQGVFPRIEVKK